MNTSPRGNFSNREAGLQKLVASTSVRLPPIHWDTGWQEYANSDGRSVRKLDPGLAPISTDLDVLGMPLRLPGLVSRLVRLLPSYRGSEISNVCVE